MFRMSIVVESVAVPKSITSGVTEAVGKEGAINGSLATSMLSG